MKEDDQVELKDWTDRAIKSIAYSGPIAKMVATFYPALDPIDLPEIDPGIRYAVAVLRFAGIETYQSCQGGLGHAFSEPTIQFHGEQPEGYRAISAALTYGLPVQALHRTWQVLDGELVGPQWEIVFWQAPVIPNGSREEIRFIEQWDEINRPWEKWHSTYPLVKKEEP